MFTRFLVIIAVSEQLIRAIMVGDDPEILVSELQNQLPDEAIEIDEYCDAGLIAAVVKSVERPDHGCEPQLFAGAGCRRYYLYNSDI